MTDAPRHDHRFESLAVFATVVRSPSLLRVQFALLLFSLCEIACWIAILVYAYDRGGATESGLVAFAQLAPAVVFAPIGAAMGDRIPRIRMLALAHASFAATTLLGAALLFAGADALLVYGAAILAGLALTLVRPAHASVLPTIARTPSELTAANVATGTVENVGVLVGSVAGGVLLAEAGTAGVWLAAGVGLGLGFLAVVGMRPAVVVRRQRLELTLDDVGPGPAIPVPGAIDAVHAADAALVASPRGGGAVLAEILAGLRVIRAEPNLRVVVLVLGLSMSLVGILDVLGVVLALDVLDAGDQGVGLISGAMGAGGLLGAGDRDQPRGPPPAAHPDAPRGRRRRAGDRGVGPRAAAGRRAARVPRRRHREERVRRRRPDDAPARVPGRDARPHLRRPRGGEHGGPRPGDARGPDPRPAARHGGRARRRSLDHPRRGHRAPPVPRPRRCLRHRPRGGAGAHPRDPDVRAAAGHGARAPRAGARPHARPARRRHHPPGRHGRPVLHHRPGPRAPSSWTGGP